MKHASYSLIHIAVIAAVAATVAPAHAKFVLEGQNIDLTKTTYNDDIIGGQYIYGSEPSKESYFGPNGEKLYDTLKDFESTTIYLGKNQKVKKEVVVEHIYTAMGLRWKRKESSILVEPMQ